MTKQVNSFVNSFILPDNIIKDMKDKIKDTKKSKIEFGFALCTDINNQANSQKNNSKIIKKSKIIEKGTSCVGTSCSIKVGKCNEHQKYIGNYHTHPRGFSTMSITDMVTGCSEDIECIGSASFNTIRCFTRKTNESQCIEEISPFEEEEHRILEKGHYIRSTIKSPKILKTNIIKLLKDISQYDTDINKYHKNRFRLLTKNFNRIDIL